MECVAKYWFYRWVTISEFWSHKNKALYRIVVWMDVFVVGRRHSTADWMVVWYRVCVSPSLTAFQSRHREWNFVLGRDLMCGCWGRYGLSSLLMFSGWKQKRLLRMVESLGVKSGWHQVRMIEEWRHTITPITLFFFLSYFISHSDVESQSILVHKVANQLLIILCE